ncbi:MAG: molecular chaperone TorD family protein [Nitrospirota bacterium]
MSGEAVERSEMARGRSYVYRLLAMLFLRELTAELLTTLKGKEVMGALKDLGVDMGDIFFDIPQEELLDALAEEYAALFIVPGGISPYESVRLKGLLCQESEWEVREFYRRCGLIVREGCPVLSDHLGMELEFMGYLTEKESKAWGDKDEKGAMEWCSLQGEFFTEHINKWVFSLLKDLKRYAFHPFYKEVVILAQRFLEVEKRCFGVE